MVPLLIFKAVPEEQADANANINRLRGFNR